jgi:3-oxoacyl-[acyl-carrier protein] reductase
MTSELLREHILVVTGAASGIGRAIALGLAAAGARVALGDLDDPSSILSEPEHFAAGGYLAAGILRPT